MMTKCLKSGMLLLGQTVLYIMSHFFLDRPYYSKTSVLLSANILDDDKISKILYLNTHCLDTLLGHTVYRWFLQGRLQLKFAQVFAWSPNRGRNDIDRRSGNLVQTEFSFLKPNCHDSPDSLFCHRKSFDLI